MSDPLLLQEEKDFRKFYRLSSWWIDHRDRFWRLALFLFATLDAVLILFAAGSLLQSFVIQEPAERLAVYGMVAYGQNDLHRYTVAQKAKPLTTAGTMSLSSGNGLYDFYGVVTNPNKDWWAEVTYRFTWGTEETVARTVAVLPDADTPLVVLGEELASAPRSVSLVLDQVTWHRVDHHLTFAPYEDWILGRVRFEVKDPTFGPSETDPKIGRVLFTLTNRSAYSYYSPTFLIRLLRGTTVVGINRVTLEHIEAGETTDVSVTWFGTLPSATRVEVLPEINPFDEAAYQSLTGETSTDTRTRVFESGR